MLPVAAPDWGALWELRNALAAFEDVADDEALIGKAKALLATIPLRQAMDNRDLQQLRSAITTAEKEKVVEVSVIEEATALSSALAQILLRQAMDKRDLRQLRRAIATAVREEVAEAALIDVLLEAKIR